MIREVLGLVKGSLLISVSGNFPERFVNLCVIDGIKLWGVKKKGGEIELCCMADDFKKMRQNAKKTSCKIKILKKQGILFKIKKYKKRKILFYGIIFFVLILAFFNSFVWSVRIDGNKNMTEEEIKILAESCGFSQGVIKYTLNVKQFQEEALKAEPRLSWIYPELKGTVLYIHVREKSTHEPPMDIKVPCRIIAKRSGRINSLTVKRGWKSVDEGNFVVEGQILISEAKEGYRSLRAEGVALASWWEEKKRNVKTEFEDTRYTGVEKNRYSVKIGSFGMSFCLSSKPPFDEYEKEESENKLKIFKDIELPFTIKKTKYKEIYKIKEDISFDEALKKAKEEMIAEAKNEIEDDVVIKNITEKLEIISENEANFTLVFEYEGDIALSEYIYTEE